MTNSAGIFNRNTIFSRMNIIFFIDAGKVTSAIFFEKTSFSEHLEEDIFCVRAYGFSFFVYMSVSNECNCQYLCETKHATLKKFSNIVLVLISLIQQNSIKKRALGKTRYRPMFL